MQFALDVLQNSTFEFQMWKMPNEERRAEKEKKNKLVKVYNPLKKQKELFATYVLTNGMFINDKRVVENARTC